VNDIHNSGIMVTGGNATFGQTAVGANARVGGTGAARQSAQPRSRSRGMALVTIKRWRRRR
jgi:hypothetical protein